jgi:signal transduction histidine kinase
MCIHCKIHSSAGKHLSRDRLLLNLLDNSIKHSPPNQVIALKVALAKSNPQETSINLDHGTPRLGTIDAFESVIIEIIDFGSGFYNSA